jgi:hypothetical protein
MDPRVIKVCYFFYFKKFTNELLVHNLGPPGMMGAKGEKGEPGLAGFIYIFS